MLFAMDRPESHKRPLRSLLDTMVESEADIKAGRVQDFDIYLARITREVNEAMAEAERREQAAGA